jgi:hypothetical protein
MRSSILLATLLFTSCSAPPPDQKPAKPSAVFEGLPLSGNEATALAAGFGNCLDATKGLRCRKDGVTIMGVGPLIAAVDLDQKRPDGSARFDHVTLWHPSDQGVVLGLEDALARAGWKSCITTDAERFWRPPSPLRIAIDTSYWGHRRVLISAPPPDPKPYC